MHCKLSRLEDIQTTLGELAAADNLRQLRSVQSCGSWIKIEGKQYYNLSSNDYLGLTDTTLQAKFFEKLQQNGSLADFLMSNPASRLVTGNSAHYDRLEDAIAKLFRAEASLVLSSGFMLNSGLLAAITTKSDLLLCDKLVHASIIDGARLCTCTVERFRHNDMAQLERLLERAAGRYRRVVVVTESVFSMDGDRAPMETLALLQQRYDFELYLDEAHAFGVEGPLGCGAAEYYNSTAVVPLRVDYLVATLGKALASQGAFVVCSTAVRELLINRIRTLIFSTALPPISLMWSQFLVEQLADMTARRKQMRRLISTMEDALGLQGLSHIIPLHAGSNRRALEMSQTMREAGYWVVAIRHPTVPEGTARLRISLSATHDEDKIRQFAELCKSFG